MAGFLYLVVCVLSGLPNSAPSSRSPTAGDSATVSSVRKWTDATGARHAKAALLRIEGEKLWMRTADGRLSTTTLSRLSEPDRQYVATHQSKLAVVRPSDSKSVVSKFVDTAGAVAPVASWFEKDQSDSPARIAPAALVYVRVSRGFLEDYVERSVKRRKPVRDCVLGTRLIGESETIGKTQLVLRPSRDKLSGEVTFTGTVTSRTTGYNGPAILQILSDATFQARKPISLSDAGLNVSPATAVAPTKLQTTNIETTLPRLLGRIATRIAWRRDAQSRSEAEAITSQHAAKTIRDDLDARVDESIAKVEQALQFKIPGLEIDSQQLTIKRFRTSADYVEMAMMRQDATVEEYSLRPPEVQGSPDIAVRVSRSIVRQAVADSELSAELAPLLGKLLDARVINKALAMARDATTNWSIHPHWIALDYTQAGP